MPIRLRVLLIIVSLLFFMVVLKNIKKAKISNDMASLWIIVCIALLLLAIFPNIISVISNLLGISTNMNTLYLIIIFILICMVFYLFVKVSILEEKITKIIQLYSLEDRKKKK